MNYVISIVQNQFVDKVRYEYKYHQTSQSKDLNKNWQRLASEVRERRKDTNITPKA